MPGRKKKFARHWCLKSKEHYVVPLSTIPIMHRKIGNIFNYHRVENKLLEIGENENELRKKAIEEQSSSPLLPDDITNTSAVNLAINNSNKRMIDDKIGLDNSIFKAKDKSNDPSAEDLLNSNNTSSSQLINEDQVSATKADAVNLDTEPVVPARSQSNMLANIDNTSLELTDTNQVPTVTENVVGLETVPINPPSSQSNLLSSTQRTTSPSLIYKNVTLSHRSSTISTLTSTAISQDQEASKLSGRSMSPMTVVHQAEVHQPPAELPTQNNFSSFDTPESFDQITLPTKEKIIPACDQNISMVRESTTNVTPVPLAPQNYSSSPSSSILKTSVISPGLLSYFEAEGCQYPQDLLMTAEFNAITSPSSTMNSTTDHDSAEKQSSNDTLLPLDFKPSHKRQKTMHISSPITAIEHNTAVNNNRSSHPESSTSSSIIETITPNEIATSPDDSASTLNRQEEKSSISPVTDGEITRIVTELLKTLPDGEITQRDVLIQRSLYLIVKRLYELRQTNISNVNDVPKIPENHVKPTENMVEIFPNCGFYISATLKTLIDAKYLEKNDWKIIVRETLLDVYGNGMIHFSATGKGPNSRPAINKKLFTGLLGWVNQGRTNENVISRKILVAEINHAISNKRDYKKRKADNSDHQQ